MFVLQIYFEALEKVYLEYKRKYFRSNSEIINFPEQLHENSKIVEFFL